MATKTTSKTSRKSTKSKPSSRSLRSAKKPVTASGSSTSKIKLCLDLLRRSEGVTVQDLIAATGWQAHSVRGFLSGTVRKKLGLDLQSSNAEGEARRYYVEG